VSSPPVRVERHESELGCWTHAVRPADPRLGSLVASSYVGFVETSASFQSWLLPPRPRATLILNLGEAFGGLPDAFVAGLGDHPSIVERGPAMTMVDLKLTPLGAYTLVGLPMHELTNEVRDLGELFGAPGRRLLDALRAAPTWDERFDLLDGFLVRRAEGGPEPAPAVRWAWTRLVETGGRLAIGELAHEVGWSHRHLIARFRAELGLPPKRLARIIRFGLLLRRLDGPEPGDWADLALDSGYYDQAHLDRDFRELAGTTPTDYLSRHVRGGDAIGDGVNSIQDAAALVA